MQAPVAVAGSPLLQIAFVAITLLVTVLFVGGVYWSGRRTGLEHRIALRRGRQAAGFALLWIAATGAAAAQGILRFQSPPTMLVLFPTILIIAVGVSLSRLGKQLATGLPIAALVGYQSFRVFVELAMHRAYAEGLMPVQMSYSGRNFDIVTGITAVLLGGWLAAGNTPSRALVLVWNTLGLGLLANVVGVALLSAPTPLRVFMNEPSNIWITHAPWVWLPAVMVLAALMGHLLVYRRLLAESGVNVPAASSLSAHSFIAS